MKWQYMRQIYDLKASGEEKEAVWDTYDDYGEKGWELVAACPLGNISKYLNEYQGPDRIMMIFKRPYGG